MGEESQPQRTLKEFIEYLRSDEPKVVLDDWEAADEIERLDAIVKRQDKTIVAQSFEVTVQKHNIDYYKEQLDAIQKVLGWKRAKDFVSGRREQK